MSKQEIDAPVDFFVSSFGPVEHDINSNSVDIGGSNLHKVVQALIRLPDGRDYHVAIKGERSSEQITADFSEVPIECNIMFFIVLIGEDEAWHPVGPMIKLRQSPQS